MLLPFFIDIGWTFFIPESGYQFVFPSFGSHNHLGDFLVLPLVYIGYQFLTRRFNWKLGFIGLFFFIHFLFSFSRSAYFAFSITVFIMYSVFFLKRPNKRTFFLFLLGCLFGGVLFLFTISVTTGSHMRFTNVIHEYLFRNSALSSKSSASGRNEYLRQSLYALKERPLFGVGPDNFEYVSQKYMLNANGEWAKTALNIFLDLGVENGIVALIIFVIGLLVILKKTEKNEWFYLTLALLINFQTDYTYRIYSMFLLFTLLLAINIYDKQMTVLHRWKQSSYIVLIIFLFTILSNFFHSIHNDQLALVTYPLNKNAYAPLIDKENALIPYITNSGLPYIYGFLFSGDPVTQRYLGDIYYKNRSYDRALTYYVRSMSINPIYSMDNTLRIYNILMREQGRAAAKKFADNLFERVSFLQDKDTIDPYNHALVTRLCQRIYSYHCPYDL